MKNCKNWKILFLSLLKCGAIEERSRSAGAERNRLLSRLNPFWLLSLICILVTFPIARRISEQKPTVCSRWKSLLFSNWWHRWRFRLRTVFNGFYRERKRRSKHFYMKIRCQKNFVKVNFWKRTFLIKIKVWNSQFDVLKRHENATFIYLPQTWSINCFNHQITLVWKRGTFLIYSISEMVWAIIPLQHRLLTVVIVGQILKWCPWKTSSTLNKM